MTHVGEQPRSWCEPRDAFGRLGANNRVWSPPDGRDPAARTKFEAAVMQNAIALHVREFKNSAGMAQEELARSDKRSDSFKAWNARLCGRRNITLQDLSVLARVVPGAVPPEAQVRVFLAVAYGSPPPPDWPWPDRCLNGNSALGTYGDRFTDDASTKV